MLEDQGPTETTETTETTGGQTPEGTGTVDTTGTTADATDTGKPDTVGGVAFDDLPAETQREIRKLREEAKNASTKAREQVAAKAREEALAEAEETRAEAVEATKAEIADAVARALGIKKDDSADLTPDQVIEQITKERDEAKAASEERDKRFRELSLEVAVQDAANMHEARADRLLDSRAFMRAVRALDPDSEGYRAAVAEAVEKAVEADNDLKAKTKPIPPAVSGGTTVAGSKTRRAEDMTIEEMIDAGYTKRR